MAQNELSALLGPIFVAFCLVAVGFIGRSILRRIPEGRLKRFLSWPNH
jgi:uncharacterized membrane protein